MTFASYSFLGLSPTRPAACLRAGTPRRNWAISQAQIAPPPSQALPWIFRFSGRSPNGWTQSHSGRHCSSSSHTHHGQPSWSRFHTRSTSIFMAQSRPSSSCFCSCCSSVLGVVVSSILFGLALVFVPFLVLPHCLTGPPGAFASSPCSLCTQQP